MPLEPLIFVQVALTETLAGDIRSLLDVRAPLGDTGKADTAIFYSITSSQTGLRGISFGNFLLKRVIGDLQRDFPRLRTFSTLSPIPGLIRWIRQNPQNLDKAITAADWKALTAAGVAKETAQAFFAALLTGDAAWTKNSPLAAALRAPLLRLAAQYLIKAKRGDRPLDSVARFHLGNGARIERLNWLADTSEKGCAQSWGIMVNYLYDLGELETNIEAYARDGKIDTTSSLRRQARD
jgi:malonyl-CoA decarboxylase